MDPEPNSSDRGGIFYMRSLASKMTAYDYCGHNEWSHDEGEPI
jgi:hypothetical protein